MLGDDKFKVINKPEIRVIYYLGMFTGQRLKDCVLLQWQNVDMEHRRIWVKQFKTGKEVTIPMAKELFEVLQEAVAWKENQYVCPKSAEHYSVATLTFSGASLDTFMGAAFQINGADVVLIDGLFYNGTEFTGFGLDKDADSIVFKAKTLAQA